MSTLLKLTAPIPERIVQVSDSEGFAVRGLNPLQVIAIYKRHAGDIEPMFLRIMDSVKATGVADADAVQPLLLALIGECPILMAELIAIASGGDPAVLEDVTILHPITREPVTMAAFDAAVLFAQNLPFPTQVDALCKIGDLTFTQDMPVGNFVALVVGLLRKAAGAMQGATSLIVAQNGSGASDAP